MVPLGHIVSEQRLAVAGADENAEGVGHLLIARNGEEARSARMHAWPDGIGTQAEQQLKDGLIGLGAHLTEAPVVFIVLPRPVAQTPVLIVNENAAISHRRRMFVGEGLRQSELCFLFRHHITPPHPRRHACQSRQLQQSVGGTTTVMALNENLSILQTQPEAIIMSLALHNADGGFFRGYRLHARHLLHILAEHLQRHLHHGIHLAHHLIGDGMLAIKPHPVIPNVMNAYCIHRHCVYQQEQCP